MIVVGLTGSIGMGKSTVLKMSRMLNVQIFDSDQVTARLLEQDRDIIAAISIRFPKAVSQGRINKNILGDCVFKNKKALEKLENLLHPKIHAEMNRFLNIKSQQRVRLVMLDIPLLFEKNRQELVQAVICVTAPFFVQKQRVLARPGMTMKKFQAICSRQLPDRDKCAMSDFVLPTGCSKAETFRRLKHFLGEISHA